jgi:hypothetical protein
MNKTRGIKIVTDSVYMQSISLLINLLHYNDELTKTRERDDQIVDELTTGRIDPKFILKPQ